MKSAIIFVITMYFAIPFTAVFPIFIRKLFSIDSVVKFWVLCILLLIAAFTGLILTGIKCAIKSAQRNDIIEKIHIFIKLAPVPLFVVNFIFLIFFSPVLLPAIIFIVPINGLMCCTVIIISGLTGMQAIRKSVKEGMTIKNYLIILQFIPMLDVISTIMLIIKRKTAD